MLTLRQQSVNVSRTLLIAALEQNLEKYKVSYKEALSEYQQACLKFTQAAVERMFVDGDFSNIHLKLQAPTDNTQDYVDAINMLRVSVDQTIQLDRDAYRAYYENKWPWSAHFNESVMGYKALL